MIDEDHSRQAMTKGHNGNLRTVMFLLSRVDCNDGVASHLETLVSGLKTLGWRVVLVTGQVHEIEAAKTRYESIKNAVCDWIVLDGIKSVKSFPNMFKRLAEIIYQFDVEVLHLHGLSLLPYAALLRLRTGRKVVVSYHPSIHSDNPRHFETSLSKSAIIKYSAVLHICRPDVIIAFSVEIFRLFANSCRYPLSRVPKIPLGIDTDHFRPPSDDERTDARTVLGLDPNDVSIVLPGRLNWNKGHDLLIAAALALAKSHPDISVRCIFPGTGYQSEEIHQAAARAPIDKRTFIFAGYVADMRSVYFAADIAVLPSRHEGFGLVIAEAMACGLPIIRTPSGGVEDQILEGVNGFRIPFDDVPALTAKIVELLDNSLRKKMGVAALNHSKKFDRDKMNSDTALIYSCLTLGK